MQNVEIKARCADLAAVERVAEEVGARRVGSQTQVDIYFSVSHGRLKLRESSGHAPQLIYYERSDIPEARLSEYRIYPVEDVVQLKAILSAALGVWQVVRKHRTLFLYDEVRLHLDNVEGLGMFLELEGVIYDNCEPAEVHRKVEGLLSQFGVRSVDLVERSYSDLLGAGEG